MDTLVRSILKKNKLPNYLKSEILKPTKIYSEEILKLTKKILLILLLTSLVAV